MKEIWADKAAGKKKTPVGVIVAIGVAVLILVSIVAYYVRDIQQESAHTRDTRAKTKQMQEETDRVRASGY